MVVLRVRLEVIRKAVDSSREQCNLDFWRPGIGGMRFVLTDYLDFSFSS
jgi:hypothetical protein